MAFGQCDDFLSLMKEGDKHVKAKEYKVALTSFTSAMVVCPDSAETAIASIKRVFEEINALKRQAEVDKQNAINAKARAEATSARLAKIQAIASKNLLMTSQAKDWRKDGFCIEAFVTDGKSFCIKKQLTD